MKTHKTQEFINTVNVFLANAALLVTTEAHVIHYTAGVRDGVREATH